MNHGGRRASFRIGGALGVALAIVSAAVPAFGCINWLAGVAIPTPRSGAVVEAVGDKIYVIAGYGPVNTLTTANEEYDPITTIWTPKAGYPGVLNDAISGAVAGGKIYTFGGVDAAWTPVVSTDVYEYNPGTDGWNPMTSMGTGRCLVGAAEYGGKIYVVGGMDGSWAPMSLVEEYTPGGGWAGKNPLPAARMQPTVVAANGKIYAFSGRDGAWTIMDSVYEYDPVGGGWTTKNPMTWPRMGAATMVMNCKIYFIGGLDGTAVPTNTVLEYDPAGDSWNMLNPMVASRAWAGGAAMGDLICVLGGTAAEWPGGAAEMSDVDRATHQSLRVSQIGGAPVRIGEPVDYQIVVTNICEYPISELIVVDTISPVITAVSVDQPGVFAPPVVASVAGGSRYVWSSAVADLDPGESFTFTISGRAGAVCGLTNVASTAYISAAGCSATQLFTNPVGEDLVGVSAGMSVSKDQVPAVPAAGGPVSYRVVVTNTGSSTIDRLIVVDTVSPVLISTTTDAPGTMGAPVIFQAATGTRYVWSSGAALLTPGASFTFTIAGTVGEVAAPTYVSNTGYIYGESVCGSLPQQTNPVSFRATSLASYDSTVVVSPSPGYIGQWLTVTLTMTNTGGSDSLNVTPHLDVNSGAGFVNYESGADPPGPMTLASGTTTTFTWTYSVSGAGTFCITATATGSDGGAGGLVAAGSGCVVLSDPARLFGSVSVSPAAVSAGQVVDVILTVTNEGGVDATGVMPFVDVNTGAGLVAVQGSVTPAGPVTIAGGATERFTWKYDTLGVGSVTFTATAAGTDSGTGGPALAAGTGALAIQLPAVLVAGGSIQPLATVSAGQWITVTLTVTNTGGAAALGVAPTLTSESEAPLVFKTGPVPAGPVAQILGGAAQTFIWTYSTSGAGALAFSLSATGLDANSLGVLFTTTRVGGLVRTPALLEANLAVSATMVDPGGTFQIMMTVTNVGEAAAAVDVPATLAVHGLGSAAVVSAPPAGPYPLAGSQALTWVWTLAAGSSGLASFSATVTGLDSGSGYTLSALAVSKEVQFFRPAIGIVGFTAGPSPIDLDVPLYRTRISVVLTLTNTVTGFDMTNVVPSVLTIEGGGEAAVISGPVPASANLLIGETTSFVWEYRPVRGGMIRFAVTATSALGGTSRQAQTGWVSIVEAGVTLDDMVVYPNPFNRETSRTGTAKFRHMPANTVIRLYTVAGELVYEREADGNGIVEWDGRNQEGTDVAPGIYLYVAQEPAGSKKIGKIQVSK